MAVVLLTLPPVHWVCSHCPAEVVTSGTVTNRFHECRGLAGITAPMVPAGVRWQVRMVEREDYIGTEDVRYDGNGRPVMAVVTDRPDGSNDAVVFPATARMRIEN